MTHANRSQKDWYSVLEAVPSDGLQELKQKYQRLALLYHPDKQGPDVSEEEAAGRLLRFLEVGQAWKVLSNQDSRREYDLQQRASQLKQHLPVDAHVGLDDMSWDQDKEVYTLGCRCGGEFCIGREELEGEEEEGEEAEEAAAVVCCDTCSLSIEVSRAAPSTLTL
ncbi:dnaJ homolog subfamily C member 24 [Hypomesus transpacificus]|uniref:dnaJ homolog subfamily C member 24 n=1 Tax=Hypomesus transpacificus TaxID=137520 RepID=UPI001F082020|nr:dnaJ homolog subfamily C member 24 [Hypomesus transpacificus]